MDSIIKMDETKITKYTYVDENFENIDYFIGSQIAMLFGYKNTTQVIQKTVSIENKVSFKDYIGIKEPKIYASQILINKQGVNELLKTNKKNLTDEIINILINLGINVLNDNDNDNDIDIDIDIDIDNDIDNELKNELTMYSYISNHFCFEYFVGYEITSHLGYQNPSKTIKDNVSKSNQIEFRYYPGIKKPELDPRTILITRDGAIEILLKTRKKITPDVFHLFKEFGISTTNKKCLTKEQQTLSAITNVFKTEKIEDQFKVNRYYLDMYFPDYKIIIECDENGHRDRKPGDERERMDIVNKILDIDDSYWIRFNPDEYDFDLSKVIGKVYRKIDELKQETKSENILENTNQISSKWLKEYEIKLKEEIKKEEEEKYLKLLEEEKKKEPKEPKEPKGEEPKWKLQIEPITGKFTAPPKEYLIEKLKTHNISDIAKSYGISTNPISKWLKQYEINIKDFHNYDAPPKEELIEQCRDKTQTEVALHYSVSNHIIRKWITNYGLDFKELKSDTKIIHKEELIKLKGEFSEEEIAEKLNMTIINSQKLMKTHNIDKIPSKEELEKMLNTKNKEDIAKHYNSCRTTLRKWIKSYGLEHIRYQITTNVKIKAIKNGETKTYSSIKELCKDIHISKRTLYKFVDTGNEYNDYLFHYVKEE